MRTKKERSFDGISIRGKETVMAEAYSEHPFSYYLIQIILVVALVYSVIFGFTTGLNLPVKPEILFGAILLIGIICWGIITFPVVGLAVSLPILLTYLYAGYRLRKELLNGFWQVENFFIFHMNKYYDTNSPGFMVDRYEPANVITLLLVFLVLPIAFILCLIILNKVSHLLYYPLTLPFIVLPFVVGQIPSSRSFAIYIATTFGVFVLGNRLKTTGARTKEERAVLKAQKKQMDTSHYKINIKGSFLMFCGILLMFLVISALFTKSVYEKKMNIPEVKKDLRVKIEKIDVNDIASRFNFLNNGKIVIFRYYTASGGLNEGELGSVGKIAYDNKTDIVIDALENSPAIYLKGFAGSTYTGNAWNGLSNEAIEEYAKYRELWESINLEAGDQTGGILRFLGEVMKLDGIGFHQDNMKIQNVGANSKYMYTPYYPSLLEHVNLDIANPEYVKSSIARKNYTFSYFSYVDDANILNRDFDAEFAGYQQDLDGVAGSSIDRRLSERLKEYIETEKQYRTFIQEYYTQVPDMGLEQLKADMSGKYAEMKEKYGEEKALGALTAYIRSYIQRGTAYTLTPGTLPRGKDFVEYFLYEKKQGFCTHYASAAAMAYRFAGVPARYVEGYIAKSSNIKNGKLIGTEHVMVSDGNGGSKEQAIAVREVRISDSGAHAWVEVYKDGWGWIPVEMTPGYVTEEEDTLTGLDGMVPSATPTPGISGVPSITPKNDGNNGKDDTDAGKTADERQISFKEIVEFLKIAVFFTLISFIAAGILIKTGRLVIFIKAEPKRKAIILYRKVKYLLKAAGISLKEEDYKGTAMVLEDTLYQMKAEEFLRFIDAVLKAKFGYAPMTKEELEWVKHYYRFAKKEVYRNIPIGKRIFYGLYFL
ncbi:transglutaminase-like domain-containing protein [Anaerocolumna xylanovorans]|uniref:Transglutaminase-like superfamily protein n=1 Tax=Anaerocolumna xylanovorans DSM 12503 TaxID=1121345 RepID=A0A1M7YNL7_9FIRM|nr:transglutaminase-like domain-containing protein [Anaerocolumna xylanovorans]SHO54195.1 Transglutaminase-like superfamily protein [Anaerocolumna xylanovorans DSM 12503]